MEFFNIKEIILKYTKSKKMLTVVLIFIIGFFLLLVSSEFSDDDKLNKADTQNTDLRLVEEERLEEILSSVDGVRKVNVMICFSDGGIKEYYKDESEDRDAENIRTDNKMVITRTDGNEIPVLKRELSPDIKGVSIVADCEKKGMEDLIYTLTSKALGVEIHKIEVVINDRSR